MTGFDPSPNLVRFAAPSRKGRRSCCSTGTALPLPLREGAGGGVHGRTEWNAAPSLRDGSCRWCWCCRKLLLTGFFFLWPAGEAIWSSLTRQDPFGLGSAFVGLENFADLFADPLYIDSIVRTVVFCAAVSLLSMSIALLLAVFADHAIRGRAT